MQILSAEDCERLILALHNGQPLSDEDLRALILELIAIRRRALDRAARSGGHDDSREAPSDPPPAT
jgi:hypothetical protein